MKLKASALVLMAVSWLSAVIGKDGKVKLWQLGGLDELLERGCERVRGYLATLDEKNSDRHLCDNIPSAPINPDK